MTLFSRAQIYMAKVQDLFWINLKRIKNYYYYFYYDKIKHIKLIKVQTSYNTVVEKS